jgi:osmotically-inducible protein OsmY
VLKKSTLATALAFTLAGWVQLGLAENYPADNTGKNVRDRNDATLTPGDQSENEADVTITREIRKAIVADDHLSTDAHNVKIITAKGVVTLRGPVETAKEKADIEAKAKQVAGVNRVDNQLEIAAD